MVWYENKHIEKTNSTYFKHMKRALTIASYASKITLAAFIHSFLPNFLPWCASETCKEMQDFICNNTDHENIAK